jgi:hypothetical protein
MFKEVTKFSSRKVLMAKAAVGRSIPPFDHIENLAGMHHLFRMPPESHIDFPWKMIYHQGCRQVFAYISLNIYQKEVLQDR